MNESYEQLIQQAVARERERCVRLCRERVELWRRSEVRNSNVPPAVQESRARGNEAAYLADLLASGETADIAPALSEN